MTKENLIGAIVVLIVIIAIVGHNATRDDCEHGDDAACHAIMHDTDNY